MSAEEKTLAAVDRLIGRGWDGADLPERVACVMRALEEAKMASLGSTLNAASRCDIIGCDREPRMCMEHSLRFLAVSDKESREVDALRKEVARLRYDVSWRDVWDAWKRKAKDQVARLPHPKRRHPR